MAKQKIPKVYPYRTLNVSLATFNLYIKDMHLEPIHWL